MWKQVGSDLKWLSWKEAVIESESIALSVGK